MNKRRLILESRLALGDVVMLTAAVRDIHLSYPGRFVTDVRTGYRDVWANNPNLTPLPDSDPEAERIECHYPLVNYANIWPYHFVHGFIHYLNRELKLAIRPWAHRGDIHLSAAEQAQPSWTAARCGADVPYWIVNAGGKMDYTTKWWSPARYQEVIDAFRDRIIFIQIGHEAHHHPPLRGVIDLRGKTALRELIHLVYRAQGVLCPITGLMHLAAAVPMPMGEKTSRPCVVIAGGLEPPHWEAYPHHQYVHTVGMLPCCATGGCWRARVKPLGDGHSWDHPDRICLNVTEGDLPRCMDLIGAAEIVRRIEGYFSGGVCSFLTGNQLTVIRRQSGITS